MMVPIRCFSCGKPVAQHWDAYNEGLEEGRSAKELFDEFGLDRFCCRQTLLGHADLIDEVAKFKV